MHDIDYTSIDNIGVSIEWIIPTVGIVRGGVDWVWGDAYQFVCVVIVNNLDQDAVIKSYLGFYNSKVRKCIMRLCKNVGIKKFTFERMNQKTRRQKEIKVT